MSDWDKGFDAYFDNLDCTTVTRLPPDPLNDWPAHRDWKRGEQAAAAYAFALHRNPGRE